VEYVVDGIYGNGMYGWSSCESKGITFHGSRSSNQSHN
jgi:hypothetical protein